MMVHNLVDFDPDLNVDFFAEEVNSNCEYISVENYNLFNLRSFVSIFSQNIRSYFANGSILQSLLDSLNFDHDFIVLTETWCSPETFALCNLDGYQCFQVYRTGVRSGGVAIFAKNNLNVRRIISAD